MTNNKERGQLESQPTHDDTHASNTSISINLSHIEARFIPPVKCVNVRKLFDTLKDCKPHSTKEITALLGNTNPRGSLQRLDGKAYGYWNIHNIGGHDGLYQMDSRHFTGSPRDDARARLESKLHYRKHSYDIAKRDSQRLTDAEQELNDVLNEISEFEKDA